MSQPCQNGAEILVEWRHWRDEVWELCPFGSLDKTKCSARLCPCSIGGQSIEPGVVDNLQMRIREMPQIPG